MGRENEQSEILLRILILIILLILIMILILIIIIGITDFFKCQMYLALCTLAGERGENRSTRVRGEKTSRRREEN